MSLVQGELPLVEDQEVLASTEASVATEDVPQEKQLSEREFKIAMAKAYKERNIKIKQNKEMLAEMSMEVDYWKAQADLLRYRFEKMDFYLKNVEIEPKYLAAIEVQNAKENEKVVNEVKPSIIQVK